MVRDQRLSVASPHSHVRTRMFTKDADVGHLGWCGRLLGGLLDWLEGCVAVCAPVRQSLQAERVSMVEIGAVFARFAARTCTGAGFRSVHGRKFVHATGRLCAVTQSIHGNGESRAQERERNRERASRMQATTHSISRSPIENGWMGTLRPAAFYKQTRTRPFT